ncbi:MULTISPECIES: hypothetical protein [unclassified Streptomyces]|uniref:hypothetical protein n=1 Tax=unclassified Streptomyces TaxID=2593676 RepID=UPI000DC7E4DD|nr:MULTISPECIES: hypothetical protein [unclassified Streptomyces]AWZ08111.1 hypothetical protein DRB89_29860 [Streptomyces sp. ICC4]AWZ12163.1 hypothetical protein DRB96_07365 [Streptomyces sp. ICC1]
MDTTSDRVPAGGDPACHLHLLCPVCGAVASERLAPCCIRYAGPVRHPRLGVLRADAEGRLVGGIDIDPAVRSAAADGDGHCEVTIAPGASGAEPGDLDGAAAHVRRVLDVLEALKDFALAHAPADWRRSCEAAGEPLLRERLFLGGLDVLSPEAIDVAFACGGLGTLLVRVDGSGRGREVRPVP